MSTLQANMAAYATMKDKLEKESLGRWVLFHDEQLIGTYASFEDAAADAIEQFGRGPYHIRQVGAPDTVTIPASLAFRMA